MSDLLAKMAEMAGLKASDAKRLESFKKKLAEKKTGNAYQVEKIKDEIRALEARALKKNKEFTDARGGVKDILKGEIERTFRDLDRLNGKREILERNLEQISEVEAKLSELEVATLRGATDEELDDLALRAQEEFSGLQADDRATEDLRKERYQGPKTEPVDIEERVSRVEAPKRKESALPADIQERLKALEPEQE
jgi:TolA-binding protein